jgi:hypothetical protein
MKIFSDRELKIFYTLAVLLILIYFSIAFIASCSYQTPDERFIKENAATKIYNDSVEQSLLDTLNFDTLQEDMPH